MRFSVDESSVDQIEAHLRACDSGFVPPLSRRVDLADYARKLHDQATRFEAWDSGSLIGLVATYLNDRRARLAHVTNVSVLPQWAKRGVATELLDRCAARAAELKFQQLSLEVSALNEVAVRLYERIGFVRVGTEFPELTMRLDLCHEEGEWHA